MLETESNIYCLLKTCLDYKKKEKLKYKEIKGSRQTNETKILPWYTNGILIGILYYTNISIFTVLGSVHLVIICLFYKFYQKSKTFY